MFLGYFVTSVHSIMQFSFYILLMTWQVARQGRNILQFLDEIAKKIACIGNICL